MFSTRVYLLPARSPISKSSNPYFFAGTVAGTVTTKTSFSSLTSLPEWYFLKIPGLLQHPQGYLFLPWYDKFELNTFDRMPHETADPNNDRKVAFDLFPRHFLGGVDRCPTAKGGLEISIIEVMIYILG